MAPLIKFDEHVQAPTIHDRCVITVGILM
jgi:hypothetical protein